MKSAIKLFKDSHIETKVWVIKTENNYYLNVFINEYSKPCDFFKDKELESYFQEYDFYIKDLPKKYQKTFFNGSDLQNICNNIFDKNYENQNNSIDNIILETSDFKINYGPLPFGKSKLFIGKIDLEFSKELVIECDKNFKNIFEIDKIEVIDYYEHPDISNFIKFNKTEFNKVEFFGNFGRFGLLSDSLYHFFLYVQGNYMENNNIFYNDISRKEHYINLARQI